MRTSKDKKARTAKDRILQVLVPPDLKARLDAYVDGLRKNDTGANESQAVRTLLREALARVDGQPVLTNDAGFNEGLRRGYSEVRKAITEAVAPLLGRRKSP